jgi:16S rRNA (uracil1498-N3)-methyltransferase
MKLFYAPELTDQPKYTLSVEESHHAIRVLRLDLGDQVVLVNGLGGWYASKITSPDPKACRVEVMDQEQGLGKPNYHLHVAIAPTKQIDRFEWFIEKATEIGISEITPLICDRSERKDVKTERLMRIVIAAMKQSLKAFHPVIHPQTNFKNFLIQNRTGSLLIAHCQEGEKRWLDEIDADPESVTILIGPEGDFSPNEIEYALHNDYQPVTLGESRLRTETAGVVAVQTVSWLSR